MSVVRDSGVLLKTSGVAFFETTSSEIEIEGFGT